MTQPETERSERDDQQTACTCGHSFWDHDLSECWARLGDGSRCPCAGFVADDDAGDS